MNGSGLARVDGVSSTAVAASKASNVTAKVAKYELRDVLKSRWMFVYAVFFLVLAEGLLRFGGGATHALVGLINVILLVVPLVGIVFGTMYLYSARDFIEMLLSQPVNRRQLYVGLYAGLAVPLAAAYVVGISIPFLLRGVPAADAGAFGSILLAGTFLTLIFVGFAFPIAIRNDERVRGLGIALGIWMGLSVIYDGLVLLIIQVASEYPLEGPVLALTLLNPVDLARVVLLLQFDVAALMGYTGAVFEKFFGSAVGTVASLGVLSLWAAVPFFVGMYWFKRKDF